MSIERNCLFPEAVTFPDFFNHNLNDQNRVLKVATGDLCWARAFYYQLFKAIFQPETDESKPVDYAGLLFHICRQLISKIQDDNEAEDLAKAAGILEKFMRTLSNNPSLSFEQEINLNSLIDQSLVKILTSIVKQGGYEQFKNEEKIKYLGQLFQEHMFEFDKGIKFEESDTFLYFQNQECIYIAFLSLVSQFQEFQEEKKDQSVERSERRPPRHYGEMEVNQNVVTSSISPIQERTEPKTNLIEEKAQARSKESPIDYLLHNKFRANENASTVEQPKPQPQQPQIKDNSLQFTLGPGYKRDEQFKHESSTKGPNEIKIKHAETIEESTESDYKLKNKESIVEQKIINRAFDQVVQTKNQEHQDLFYKPVPIGSNKNSPSSVNSRPSMKKDPLDICNDYEKGTFYRKFTDTRILNMLSQPYRTKVKMLKTRFVGVHSRDHRPALYQKQF